MDVACDSIDGEKGNSLTSPSGSSLDVTITQENEKQGQDKSKEASAREVAIQANDYEIERVSSTLPARKKYVPLKFSDYRVFAGGGSVDQKDEEDEEENEDVTFDPEKSHVKKTAKTPSGRGRGRPRKHAPPAEGSANGIEAKLGTGKKNVISKVPSGFKCGMCGRIFSLRGNAKAHMITHTDQRPFSCDFEGCGKQLRTKESLRRHQLSHLGIKMFECSECKKKFSCNATLQEHMARHTGVKPLSCPECGRKFRQVTVLKRHILTHSNEKPFACTICGRRFAMKVYVQSHMKTHTGERPYTCDTCNKSFAHASDLNRHKIIHTGKKPYACAVCSARFSDASSRRRHEQEHQNKQQYMCHLCNQRFMRAGQLRSHLMREHNTDSTETMYEVQVVDKPSQGSWPVSNSQPRLVSMLHNVQATPTTAVSGDENAVQEVQAEENLTEMVPASTGVHVFVDSSQLAQPLQEQSETLESGSQEDRSKTLTTVPEISPSDQLASLPSVYTYKIIGQVEGNEVYEFQLEESSSDPAGEIACQVSFQDGQLQVNDTPLTLIHQEDNTFTLVQPSSSASIALQNSVDDITDPSLHELQNSNDIQTETLLPQEMRQNASEADTKLAPSDLPDESVTESNSGPVSNPTPSQVSEIVNEGDIDKSANNEEDMNAETPTFVVQAEVPCNEDSNYIYNPDLNSQDYYNWLSAFTEQCKLLSMPLDKNMFQKISHVQKTLSDFMALPSGVITDKNNFKVLLSITHDLSDITSKHLTFMLHNLS